MLWNLLRLPVWVAVWAGCSASLWAAGLPEPEAIQADLTGQFQTHPAMAAKVKKGPLAERALAHTRREVAALRKTLTPWEKDPRARLWTKGAHTEHGIRPNTQPMVAFATVALWGETPREREQALADLVALLRFVAPTHSAGPLTANDGAKWENQWQSALWAFQAGVASWLVWDRLDPELRWLVANLVCSEADRFVDQLPPARIERDTKAEENAWNSMVIALAANMFPRHPRAALWHETAVRWQLSAFLRPEDTVSDTVVDGRPLRDWALGANLHSDFTLENHDRIHPAYMTTISMNLAQHLLYKWSGAKSPEALQFNARPVYQHIKFLSHPDGQLHYPNGQDWELHRPYPLLHAMMSVLFKDPEAAHLERASLETIEKMQARSIDGPSLLPNEYFFPSLPAVFAYNSAMTFLFHAVLGEGAAPVAEKAFQRRQAGVRVYESGEFLVQRSPAGLASFSWGRRVMGMAIPFAKDLMGTPHEGGYLGVVTVEGDAGGEAPGRPVVEKIFIENAEDHFSVAARLGRAGGAIQHQVRFVSLPNGLVVYMERLTARRPLKIARMETGVIGVLNEPEWVYQDGERHLRWAGGGLDVSGTGPATNLAIRSSWVNIDDQWGFITVGGNGWRYDATTGVHRGRREQRLYLMPPARTEFAESDVIAQRVTVTALGVDATNTKFLLEQLKREGSLQTGRVQFHLTGWLITTDFDAPEPNITVERVAPEQDAPEGLDQFPFPTPEQALP